MDIHAAARAGNLKALRAAVRRGENVNSLNKDGNNPLLIAAWEGNTDTVKELLSSGATVDLANKDGYTPLILAAWGGHTDTVRELLSSGATVDLANNVGDTPLMRAAWDGHTGTVRELFSYGATVDLADKFGDTPLCLAASSGYTDTVSELLSSGATVDLANKYGVTPLHLAAMEGHTDTVNELLSFKAFVDLADNVGNTPLILAARGGHTDIVRKLLSSGATVDLANIDGETALVSARGSQKFNEEIICLLEEATQTTMIKDMSDDDHMSANLDADDDESEPDEFLMQSVPVLPKNWAVVTDKEMKKPIYQKSDKTVTSSTPPMYPLRQTSTYPNVTFYDEPQERKFTSIGGHVSYDNGVEITLLPCTIPPGSTVGIKVQPSLAPQSVFVMPQDIQSASPSYLISSEGSANLEGEVTVTMEHHVKVSTSEEADNLVFLQADSSPDPGSVYKYQEVSEGKSEFTPGENTGKLTTRGFSKRFLKIGAKIKNWFKGSKPVSSSDTGDSPQSTSPPHVPNLYTVKVYRSLQTTGDRLAIICISLYCRLYAKWLETFDKKVIPHEYPEVSSQSVDKTTLKPVNFEDTCAKLNIHPVQGWSIVPDKEMIFKVEVDQLKDFEPQDLHDYPPRIVCRFSPEEHAPTKTTSTLSFIGLIPEVKFNTELKISTVSRVLVGATKLQVATDQLKSTLLQVSYSELTAVDSIVSLMEKMAVSLCSSSLSDLAVHTSLISREITSVLKFTKKVAESCTRQTIRENINIYLSKIEALSHQLSHVTQTKLMYCHDQSDKTNALIDLVEESGANLLRNVDCLLKELQKLSDIDGNEKVSRLKKTTHLHILKEAIWDVRVEWRDFGGALKVPSDVLDEIDSDGHLRNDGQRIEKVLVKWLHTGTTTIHQLLRALEDKCVGRHDIAIEIRSRIGDNRTAIGLCNVHCSVCELST